MLDVVISENQSTFVGGRQILDGILILNNEIWMKQKRKKIKRAFFKIDFAKAYDTVDWDFLEDMLKGMNFPSKWRRWVCEFLSSAWTSFLINGSPSDNFNLERGIRQGDPMSPFLFLIVAEGLSLLVKRAVEIGILEASEVGRNKVKVTHLQYANDTIFTCPAKMSNIVNFHKCALLGVNTEISLVENMARYLQCKVSKVLFSYLGLNIGINHWLLRSWSILIEKVRRRINSWKGKNLSFGGRITLIQSVLSSVPIYYLSFFRLPKTTIRVLANIQRKFLWGGCEETDKIP